jgi:MSHA biogenesis protein MshL
MDYLDMVGETNIDVGGDMLASGVEGAGVKGKYQVTGKREAKNTNVWGGITAALEGIKSPDGVLRVDPNAGIIYMADTPAKIETMVRLLDSLSEALHRQVFIEARILEVNLSDNSRYGLDWSKMSVGFSAAGGQFGDIAKNLPDVLSIGINSGSSLFLSNQSQLTAVLDFLKTQGDVSVISNPHLSVLNNQSAVLTVGYQLPYGDIESVSRDPETKEVTIDAKIKRAILGLQLGLTPQISKDGIVTLHIVPTITEIKGWKNVDIPTGTNIQSISNPIIDLRELATTVRVREGNTVVLAGLISQIRQLNEAGLPVLSSIPYIKNFFRHMENIHENRELVIFITPYIKTIGPKAGE